MSEDDKQTILIFHNEKRSTVAAGHELRGLPGPQPAASDMMEMTWDEELAGMAQYWANQCKWQHRRDKKFSESNIGENIAQV